MKEHAITEKLVKVYALHEYRERTKGGYELVEIIRDVSLYEIGNTMQQHKYKKMRIEEYYIAKNW